MPRAMGPAPVAKPAATGNSLDRLLPAEAIDNPNAARQALTCAYRDRRTRSVAMRKFR